LATSGAFNVGQTISSLLSTCERMTSLTILYPNMKKDQNSENPHTARTKFNVGLPNQVMAGKPLHFVSCLCA
jgi:hypothetical protein